MSQLLDQISEKQNIQNCLEELVNEIQERTTHGSKPDYLKHTKTSFEKNCFSAWASTLNMGLINKVDMVCLSPVGYDV